MKSFQKFQDIQLSEVNTYEVNKTDRHHLNR
jgi:hypothetical protein